MKKRLLLVGILLIFIGSAATAQTFNYGLKGSLMFSNIHGAGLKKSFSPGFQGGVYGEWDFSPKWGLEPEILFTQAVSKRDPSFSTYYVTYGNTEADPKAKLSYVTVPILFRYHLTPTLTLNFGAQYNYLFYANENLLLYNKNAFKSSDVQGVVGLQIQVANVHFFGRYALGMNNVNAIDNRFTWESQQLNFGIGIDLSPMKDAKKAKDKK